MRKLLTAILLLLALSAAAVDRNDLSRALDRLDSCLAAQSEIRRTKEAHIDSLRALLGTGPSPDLMMRIADAYKGYNNDSAMAYLRHGAGISTGTDHLVFIWKLASLMPLNGFFDRAVKTYETVPADSVPPQLAASYYDAGRQMYSYLSVFFRDYPEIAAEQQMHANELQTKLIEVLPPDSPDYHFNLGELYFLNGHNGRARVLLEKVLDDANTDAKLNARAAHHLSTIHMEDGDTVAGLYYLTLSATSDLVSATREIASLQELGREIFNSGDIRRSYTYLSSALENAVSCGAPLRMVETSKMLPFIESAYSSHIASNRRTLYFVVIGLVTVLVVLIITMFVLRHEMKKMSRLQTRLRAANTAKEVYISRFLQLCSIYMDKLNQFCKIATRKLAAGQADELFRMTKSGKFIEEQSREFYEVFDNAFLHIYPNFVAEVNKLLRPDAQITLQPDEMLNTDLRILAFMRLGIEESARIAQVLNYSLNTIYAYRNRLKSRAINRETFESDIMKIDSAS